MRAAFKAIDPVQQDLAARVALIGVCAGTASTAQLAAEVDAIRAAALLHGMYPAVAVARVITTALACGERGSLVLGWMAILGDAVSGDRHDDCACQTYVAACSVRLTF